MSVMVFQINGKFTVCSIACSWKIMESLKGTTTKEAFSSDDVMHRSYDRMGCFMSLTKKIKFA